MKIRPNDPCPCGSGQKFKKCCKPRTLHTLSVPGFSKVEHFSYIHDETYGRVALFDVKGDGDQMELDRAIQDAGFNEWIRPIIESDKPTGELVHGEPGTMFEWGMDFITAKRDLGFVLVLVKEQGFRLRMPVGLHDRSLPAAPADSR